jgi:YHS domain-containing protein
VTFDFASKLAHVRLKLACYADAQVRKVTLSYDLEIIPMLMKFTPHVEIEFPLESVNQEAVAMWIDDRLVEFVQSYLALGENEYYLKDQMVEDPVANVRFPNMAAAATLDWNGQKYYFISDETRREFARQHKIADV